MSKSRQPNSIHSWIGIAAYEILRNTACGASKAAKRASWLADHLMNSCNEELLELDPRKSTWEFWPIDRKCAKTVDGATACKTWVAKATYEIGVTTTANLREARKLALNLAMHINSKGLRFMDTDPRKAARAHFDEARLGADTTEAERVRKALGFDLNQFAFRVPVPLAA